MHRVQEVEGCKIVGPFILMPIDTIIAPKEGYVVMTDRYWVVTKDNEVLFFLSLSSPQCNRSKDVCDNPGLYFHDGADLRHEVRFMSCVYVPKEVYYG